MAGFNQLYYSFSPAVADLERENVAFRDAVRVAITPALYTLSIMTLADQNSDASVIAFWAPHDCRHGGHLRGGTSPGDTRRWQEDKEQARSGFCGTAGGIGGMITHWGL